jgi:hypothetical protein
VHLCEGNTSAILLQAVGHYPVAMSYGIKGDEDEQRRSSRHKIVTVVYEGSLVEESVLIWPFLARFCRLSICD